MLDAWETRGEGGFAEHLAGVLRAIFYLYVRGRWRTARHFLFVCSSSFAYCAPFYLFELMARAIPIFMFERALWRTDRLCNNVCLR